MGAQPSRYDIRAVVLDMGGVVVRLGDYTELAGDRGLSSEEFWAEWLASPAVAAFERGLIDDSTFAARYVAEVGSGAHRGCGPGNQTPQGFLRAFAAWPKGLYPGAAEVIAATADRVPVHCLSNTNPTHWFGQKDSAVIRGLFERTYLSFQVGLVKPDPRIFRRVIDDLGLAPPEILFLDDNQINVDAAGAEGITARRVRGGQN